LPASPGESPGTAAPAAGGIDAGNDVRWHFGAFTLWENQRRLERSGQPVHLGPRTFDLLLQLLRHAGKPIGREQLLSTVWQGVVVEETSVRVHMSLLRKALGAPGDGDGCTEWITTIPRRGYLFAGTVHREQASPAAIERAASGPALAHLPVRLDPLLGREHDVSTVLSALDVQRLVTIVGPGGIGKTSIAIRTAERLQSRQAVRIAFADLAPLISSRHVHGTVIRALGAAADLPDPVQVIARTLAGQDVLLLIDNCEHVIGALPDLLIHLLGALPRLRVLATSREPLQLTGEYVLRLPALAVPASEALTLSQALAWPAVALLVERARAAGARAFDDADAPLLARIARRLDGMPLAIELIAARLGVQPIGSLAQQLENHLPLHAVGPRSAQARHRTLAAALDWSVTLLDPDELQVFRRLSVFRGRFDVDSALAVIAGDMDRGRALDTLVSIVNKSLVLFDRGEASAPYRLLDTTRSYATGLLSKSDERPLLLQRHAMLMLESMKAAVAALSTLGSDDWVERHGRHLDDIRFVLEAGTTGQVELHLAATLAALSRPLWFHMSQVAEYRDRVTAILALVDQQDQPDTEDQTQLLIALAVTLLHADGLNAELGDICERGLVGARLLGSHVLELQARWGRCTHDMFRGEYAAAWQQAQTLQSTVQAWADPAALNLALRVNAMANHFCGRFEESRQHSEASLLPIGGRGLTRARMVGVDPAVAALAMLARTQWIQGATMQALDTARKAVTRAEAAGNAPSLCSALYGACPVALWAGELELASDWIGVMHDQAQHHGLVGWLRYAEWFIQGLELHTAADPAAHVREVLSQFACYDAPRREMLLSFCPDWIDDEMISRIASGEGLWVAAEAWRAMGRRNENLGKPDVAEGFYLQAINTAQQQGAVAWERRAAVSLAGLRANQGRGHEAIPLLDMALAGGAEGHRDHAVVLARQLRQQLGRPGRPLAVGRSKASTRSRGKPH
jgi:predicted ATPase/DNA-binding winged helix-turn-helix (wHTH) protein